MKSKCELLLQFCVSVHVKNGKFKFIQFGQSEKVAIAATKITKIITTTATTRPYEQNVDELKETEEGEKQAKQKRNESENLYDDPLDGITLYQCDA